MTVLGFLRLSGEIDYGRRFSRLRWRRAVGAQASVCLRPEEAAQERLRGGDAWMIVVDDRALPMGRPTEPGPGQILVPASPAIPAIHTLRELEEAAAGMEPDAAASPRAASAFCLRPEENPPRAGETIAAYLERVGASNRLETDPRFAAFALEDLSGRERPELARRIPSATRRLLDVGCGAGGTSGALKKRFAPLVVVGVERDRGAAERAGTVLDRVLEEEACRALARLAEEGETFDAFLFGDVLEHLTDPVAALTLARRLAARDATLVASVPNVGHLSLARDLALGRFDPTPAGLADASHLRWFDRRLFAETLEESGWRVTSIEGEAGAPAPHAEEFLAALSGWPDLDHESLATYQWIAVARPAPPIG